MENFAALAHALVTAGGALQPDDELALTNALRELLRDAPARDQLIQRARAVLDVHRGATERTAQLVGELSESAPPHISLPG